MLYYCTVTHPKLSEELDLCTEAGQLIAPTQLGCQPGKCHKPDSLNMKLQADWGDAGTVELEMEKGKNILEQIYKSVGQGNKKCLQFNEDIQDNK